jgi:hypothetical protein
MSTDASESASVDLVSQALLTEVTKKVRELGLVAWVDAEGHYTAWADRLAPRAGTHDAPFPFPIVRYRSSYLELMLALEPFANDLHPEHVLVHLPGLNKDSVRETPAFELYKAGKTFEKNLATLVREAARGEARPEQVEAFLAAGNVSLESADAWLAGLRAAPRDEFALRMEAWGIEDVALGLFRGDPRFLQGLPKQGERLFEFLEKGLGVTDAWREFMNIEEQLTEGAATTLVASWLMAVEFATDLASIPSTPALQPLTKLGPFKDVCRRLAERARNEEPDTYRDFADQLQERFVSDRSHPASALGSIDTFRFEEATTRRAALSALTGADWDEATRFASEHTPQKCFWVRRSPELQRTWEVIRHAADAGRAIAESPQGLKGCASLEEAVDRYASRLAAIDRAHRFFEQRAHALIAHDLDDYDQLLEARTAVRTVYRVWADGLARAFAELCRTYGALPPPDLRQRHLFNSVVQPIVEQGGRVAFFMVDALRFEMAQALAEELKRDKFSAVLQARLAELPTITSVGMNALAPIEKNGRLQPSFDGDKLTGLRNQEYAVKTPADRVRAMRERCGTALDLPLDELSTLSSVELKKRLGTKPGLIVVRSRELDDAGEVGLHLGTFDHTLTLLRSAVSMLQQAGVERFVIASDHGFLLQDNKVEKHPFSSSKRIADRRHVLAAAPSGMPDVLEVPFAALEYDSATPQFLVFRQDTALWDVAPTVAPFVHGGNSLQERVIPVLILERSGKRGKTTTKYEIVAEPEVGRLGRQRLKLSVRLQKDSSAALSFHAPKTIALALRIPKRGDIQLTLLDATPPAKLNDGRILLPPNGESTVVEFELEGQTDQMLRVEVFHPDAVEDVEPKVVEGFFEVFRNRRSPKAREVEPSPVAPPAALSAQPSADVAAPASSPGPAGDWKSLIEDAGFREVLVYIQQRRTMNEAELAQALGSARRVRAFSREFDNLMSRVSFSVEIVIVSGLKTYVRKD